MGLLAGEEGIVKALVLLALAVAACSPAADECAAAQDHATECGATYEPATCDPCASRCYAAATCIEITGRLNWPQPGEADGGTLYSNLDVCLAKCSAPPPSSDPCQVCGPTACHNVCVDGG